MNNSKILGLLSSTDIESFLLGLSLISKEKFNSWCENFSDERFIRTLNIFNSQDIYFFRWGGIVVCGETPIDMFIQAQSDFVKTIKLYLNAIS